MPQHMRMYRKLQLGSLASLIAKILIIEMPRADQPRCQSKLARRTAPLSAWCRCPRPRRKTVSLFDAAERLRPGTGRLNPALPVIVISNVSLRLLNSRSGKLWRSVYSLTRLVRPAAFNRRPADGIEYSLIDRMIFVTTREQIKARPGEQRKMPSLPALKERMTGIPMPTKSETHSKNSRKWRKRILAIAIEGPVAS